MFDIQKACIDHGEGHCRRQGHHGLYCGNHCLSYSYCSDRNKKAKPIQTSTSNKTAIVRSASGTVVEIPLVDSRDYMLVEDVAAMFDNSVPREKEVIEDFTTPVVKKEAKNTATSSAKPKTEPKTSKNDLSDLFNKENLTKEEEAVLENDAQDAGAKLSLIDSDEQKEIDKQHGCYEYSEDEMEDGYVDGCQGITKAIDFEAEPSKEDLALFGVSEEDENIINNIINNKAPDSEAKSKSGQKEFLIKGGIASNSIGYGKISFDVSSNIE